VGQVIERRLLGPGPVAILSDDCWGGEFCRAVGCAYTTPLAGAYVEPRDYLTLLENLHRPDAFRLWPLGVRRGHLVCRTPYATIHYLHTASWAEIERALPRRLERMQGARLFHKIDFGKPGYRQVDVDRWNALALPNAVALLPPTPRMALDLTRVHQGVKVDRWMLHGLAMFHFSRRSFDFHHWIRTGRLRKSRVNRALNFLFWDTWAPSEVKQLLFPARTKRFQRASPIQPPATCRMEPSGPLTQPTSARAGSDVVEASGAGAECRAAPSPANGVDAKAKTTKSCSRVRPLFSPR
jgi:uncharacterized protein (DUF1919 family)